MKKLGLILLTGFILTGCSNNTLEVVSNTDKYLTNRYGEKLNFIIENVEDNKVLVTSDILSDNTGFIVKTTDVDNLDEYIDYYEYTYACREVAENIEWYVQKVNRENNIRIDIKSSTIGISSKDIDNKGLENVTLKLLEENGLSNTIEINVFIAESEKDIHLDDVYDSIKLGLENHGYLYGNITVYENIDENRYKDIVAGMELGWSSGLNKISTANFRYGNITDRNDREASE